MTQSLAERLHAAFVEASEWSEAPAFNEWPDGGAAWYALASAREDILTAPEMTEPYGYDLRTPIPARFKGDVEIMETLPTSLHIRPRVAGDLCLPECDKGGQLYQTAVQSRIHGVSARMLEDRIDPVDAQVGVYLIAQATGVTASSALGTKAAGLMPEVPEDVMESMTWDLVAYALLVEDEGNRMLVHCRTPGLGTLTIGPYKVRHKRILDDTSRDTNAWEGRLATIADLTGKTLAEIKAARIEDIDRMWGAFEHLKKNATEMAMSIFLQRHFTPSSTSDPSTSTTGPTQS